jgi:hypothetical protein
MGDMPWVATLGSVVGAVVGGKLDLYYQYTKDAQGNQVPVTDNKKWNSDPSMRSGLVGAIGLAAMFGSTYFEDGIISKTVQGAGQGMLVYAGYNIAKEKVFKKQDGTYSIAGMPYPMQSIGATMPYLSPQIATAENGYYQPAMQRPPVRQNHNVRMHNNNLRPVG